MWVVLLQELFRLPLVVYSCLTDEIMWRGRRYRVERDGTTRFAGTRG